jgi:histidine triad (HIT) family protein
MECAFCNIVARKTEAEIVFENENIISFLDIRPVNFGHTLVIPKKHYEDFLSLPPEELADLSKKTQTIAEAVKHSLKADGFNIIVNHGAAAGQTIFHFHFHIIPRFRNDFRFKPAFKSYESGSKKNYADKIRTQLNQ